MKGPIAVRFTVEGVSAFPLDMLRYDSCFPFDQESVANIERSFSAHQRVAVRDCDKPFRVTLMAISRSGSWTPTGARWQSFGWKVDAHSISGASL